MHTKQNHTITVIAGPCSLNPMNINELYEIADITVKGKRAIKGTRLVGLKSRTSLSLDGNNMGIDYAVFMRNHARLVDGQGPSEFEEPPTVTIAKQLCKETGLSVGFEVMSPLVQLPCIQDEVFNDKVLIWSPAVNQLGWPVMQMAAFAQKNGWSVGIKNGKWVGMEKTWAGLSTYAHGHLAPDNVIMIQRGVESPENGKYRNLPLHETSKHMKEQGMQVYFDPSHSYGPLLRDDIVRGSVEAMKMTTDTGEYVYDGLLIEAGTSTTDTDQHITHKELGDLCEQLSEFRELVSPV
ncbi:MAG: hypothetical protein WCO78_03625 [Candidatus Roizmanbacteria bacterium]